ncbi:hypothetical protein KCU99_g10237, partial [Aureobasidium melanogenum]
MAIVKWGIDHPNNPRNKENPELAKKLEEERRNFVGTATKGAIRTNPDGTIMGSRAGVKVSKGQSDDKEQTGAKRMPSEEKPEDKTTIEP